MPSLQRPSITQSRTGCREPDERTMRRFNTEGPMLPDRHYAVPPLGRVDLDHVLDLIDDARCFVLHAPARPANLRANGPSRPARNRSRLPLRVRQRRGGTVRPGGCRRSHAGNPQPKLPPEHGFTTGDDFLDGRWPAILDKAGPHGSAFGPLRPHPGEDVAGESLPPRTRSERPHGDSLGPVSNRPRTA